MQRREFITLFGGAAAASWPFVARAQQGERIRRVGVLLNTAADHRDRQADVAAFVHALQQLGWTEGRNVQVDIRWSGGQAREIRRNADELIALASGRCRRNRQCGHGSGVAGDPYRAHRVQ
jgi:putative tryptophan/tyrosine transport system substrate-binding protein